MWKKAEEKLILDEYIGPLIKKYGSCTISKNKRENYFSDIVESIVGQQLSGNAADAIFKRLEQALGRIAAKNIIKAKKQELRNCGLSWGKIKYLKDLSHNVDRGVLVIEKLEVLSNEEIIENLTKVKGIGRWTSEMFLIFSLARPDIFPVDDLGIRNGMRKILNINLEPEKIKKFALRWKPYRSVAAWYIWKSLDNR